jgi:hypothetical protein
LVPTHLTIRVPFMPTSDPPPSEGSRV